MISVRSQKENIWETNPHLELVTEFINLKKELGPVKSSKLLIALYYINDPKSPLRSSGMSPEEIREDLTKNYLTYKNFKWDDYASVEDLYKEKMLSPLDKMFIRYEKDLKDLEGVLSGWKFSKEDITERSNALKNYKNLLADYVELTSKVEEEKKSNTRAGYKESLAEQLGK